MPQFTYRAKDSEGKTVQGKIEAASLQAAQVALQEMKLQTEELYEAPHQSSAMPPPLPWNVQEEKKSSPGYSVRPESVPLVLPAKPAKNYASLLDTFRIYAGWLLAWYFLIYAFGSLLVLRENAPDIPFLYALFVSPVVLLFSLCAFLFLLLSSVHRMLKGNTGMGIILALLGIATVVIYQMNIG